MNGESIVHRCEVEFSDGFGNEEFEDHPHGRGRSGRRRRIPKVFRPRRGDVEQLRRQEAEVRILAGMSHHALVTLFDAAADFRNKDSVVSYVVMELVRGPDLRQRLSQGPISAAQMVQIGHDVADGLAYVHHHGIVHRDVKPANILLVDYRKDVVRLHAKLTDFGVALNLGEASADEPGTSTGTPHYLSPEQAAGEPVGPASDVYSLGLVLLEGLTGEVAYPAPRSRQPLPGFCATRTFPLELHGAGLGC